jgi:hypothetical protein
MKLNVERVDSVAQEPKYGDLVRYRLYENQAALVYGIFIRKLFETRPSSEEMIEETLEMHEIYCFETGYYEKVFAFELDGLGELNE